MAWTVDWQVFLNGLDVSGDLSPVLQDIRTTDKDGESSDSCSLTLDDSDGQILLPRRGSKLRVLINGIQVFEGVTSAPKSSGARGSGRLLKVSAKGFDARGKVKEPQQFHQDVADLQSFLGKAAENAEFSLAVDDEFASVNRDYWAADGESFLHLGQRLAREMNATFKLRNNEKAVFIKRGIDKGLPIVTATYGDNLNSWDITPTGDRGAFKRARAKWFDRESAEFKYVDVEFETDDDQPDATNLIRTAAADKDQATGIGEARKGEAEREGGGGTVSMEIAPEAQAEGALVLVGARAGVDGTYRITSVSHRANRSGGATTNLDVKQPQGGAGTDSRSTATGSGGLNAVDQAAIDTGQI